LAVRRAESQSLVEDLMTYMREQAAKLSRAADLVKGPDRAIRSQVIYQYSDGLSP
jgi:hypothetical protein